MSIQFGVAGQPSGDNDPFDMFKKYLDQLGIDPPDWFLKTLLGMLVFGLIVAAAQPFVPFLREALNLVRWFAGRKLSTERRRRRKRRMFARHLESRLQALELQEDWRDEKYAELEAEVEIEQNWRQRWMRKLLPFKRTTLRRVKSLSQALARSGEPLVLLEGEPGAGKSIALRHLARILCRRAIKSNDIRAAIPLYLNLKKLNIRPDKVAADDIRNFVLETLGEANSRDVQEVLDSEFDRGLEEGTWIFLFDSFDEIPDVLSAEDARQVVSLYARAIANFLAPFGRCRGIVASRDFSSPDAAQFTRFRILRLSRRQQSRLVKRSDLESPVDRALRAGLENASKDVETFAGNPMFLGLLCEYMRSGSEFPASSHAVFEEYLTHRLRRDSQRIEKRFGLVADFVRAGAEEIAFLMTSVPRMGLTPSRATLLGHASALEGIAPKFMSTILDALEYVKLGRVDMTAAGGATFFFVHRRFQEYFATCVVIRSRKRLTVDVLLENDRWRETAVALLQIQSGEEARPLIDEAKDRLKGYADEAERDRFHWPAGCLHILGILAAGLETHPDAMTEDLKRSIDRVLQRAWDFGNRLDKRRTLAFVNIASLQVAERILTEAFLSRNEFIREGAFAGAGSLSMLSEGLRAQIRRTLLGFAATAQIYRKRGSISAQVKRLPRPTKFLSQLNLLSVALPVSVILSMGGMFQALRDFLANRGNDAAYVQATLFLGTFFVFIGATVVAAAFSQVSLRRGKGRLGKAILHAASMERRLFRAFSVALLLAVNATFCLASAAYMAGSGNTSIMFSFFLLAYGSLWPAAVIWASRTGIGTHFAYWLVLPMMLLTVGASRVPRWCRHRAMQLRDWGDGSLWSALRKLAAVARNAIPRIVISIFTVVGSIGGATAFVYVTISIEGLVDFFFWGMIAGLLVWLSLVFMLSGVTLRAGLAGAQSVDDIANLFLRARTNLALSYVVHRLSVRGVARDSEVRTFLERVVSEIEHAQVRAESEPGLLFRKGCASLSGGNASYNAFFDSWPIRRWATLRVLSIQEETLDELARLIEHAETISAHS